MWDPIQRTFLFKGIWGLVEWGGLAFCLAVLPAGGEKAIGFGAVDSTEAAHPLLTSIR